MNGPTTTPIPWAVFLDEDRMPRREELVLPDGYRTTVYVYDRRGAAGGLPVMYVHGIQSHPGWFVRSAAHLADQGHAVFQVTRRGSGENCLDRGHAASAGQLLDDLEAACRFALERTGADGMHLVGISWGGKLATAFTLRSRWREIIASLTLVAPGIAAKADVSPVTKLAIAMSLAVAPKRYFRIPLDEVELFTDNPKMQQYLWADPRRLKRATARFFFASRCLDRMLRRAPVGGVYTPTTLLLARRDRIIDNEKTRQAVSRLTDNNARIVVLDGMHTLEFEPDPGDFLTALARAVRQGEQRVEL